ncbi:MAG: glycosyltransferase 61 family protein [Paracoccus sp. (in: a-proteobacteria)]|uniref:glycosyltransferase family 61 protein n=1 Tax=Paracoccus sp. TaxID=267 RepID=UPI0026E04E48|nr:glycosyltransferase 61 family protein [Paracoccus sp. (in: a-proteobacteria)]MDO5619958.1 glycosyltransferase 61 family protein [Paracoccus sp. (in: a-proteobacteria)]
MFVDESFEPSPDHGWSREVRPVEGATIIPPTNMLAFPTCGVLDSSGTDLPEAAIYRSSAEGRLRRMMLPPKPAQGPVARLSGTHLWGGQIFNHFGHFLTESISRLWAVADHPADSIVFVGRHKEMTDLQQWHRNFLTMAGIDLPVRLITEPTQVERLLVPGQGFGLGPIARGTPEFRAFGHRLAEQIEPKGDDRIYISRTRQGKKGRALNEVQIEDNMRRNGYGIYYPERHSLAEQLAQYRKASHIVGLDSSAFHLAGLIARPGQKIAIILRRNMSAYYNIQRQFEGMTGTSPDILNVLEGDWMPEKHKGASRLSWGQLDHAALARLLAERGYIDSADDWHLPTETQKEGALQGLAKHMGGAAMKFVPADTPIDQQMAGRH